MLFKNTCCIIPNDCKGLHVSRLHAGLPSDRLGCKILFQRRALSKPCMLQQMQLRHIPWHLRRRLRWQALPRTLAWQESPWSSVSGLPLAPLWPALQCSSL